MKDNRRGTTVHSHFPYANIINFFKTPCRSSVDDQLFLPQLVNEIVILELL
jgi:hypothetical protein